MAYEDRETLIGHIRATRDHKLALSDVDMLRSVEGAASFAAFATARADWSTYRQSLRDYPSVFPDELEDDLSDMPAMPLSPNEQIPEE
jgi:hypothetical protein